MVYVVGGLIDGFGESEIQYLYGSFGCDFDVGRFQIAVHDAFVVGCFEGPSHLFRDSCLRKDPKDRLQAISDWRLLIDDTVEAPAHARQGKSVPARLWIGVLAGALAIVTLLVAALSFVYFHEKNPAQETLRMSVLLPEKSRVLSIAVSPDGREIAMALVKNGKQQIWVRPLSALEPTELAGTDDARNLFWSPDSRYIGFFADARLKRVEHTGGPVQVLCDALGADGGTWSSRGDILFGGLFHMQKIPAAGGALTNLAKIADGEGFPFLLPGGQHYLAVRGGNGLEAGVWLNSVDGANPRRLLPDSSRAELIEPLPDASVGAVLFARDGTLMAVPFDMKRLEAAGEPFAVAKPIAMDDPSNWLGGVSKNGVLAYVSGLRGTAKCVWRDRQGNAIREAGDARSVVEISPDGKQLVMDRGLGLFRVEFASGVATQLTPRGVDPVWSPDGRYVAFYGKGGFIGNRRTALAPKSCCLARMVRCCRKVGRRTDAISFTHASSLARVRTCLPRRWTSSRRRLTSPSPRPMKVKGCFLPMAAGSRTHRTSQAKARSMLFRSRLRTARNGWFRGAEVCNRGGGATAKSCSTFRRTLKSWLLPSRLGRCSDPATPKRCFRRDCKSRTPYRSRELGHRARRSVSYNYVQLDRRVAKRGSELAWWARSTAPSKCAFAAMSPQTF